MSGFGATQVSVYFLLRVHGQTAHLHADGGSITIHLSQPVAGLQILMRDGGWKWVKHVENALVCGFKLSDFGFNIDFLKPQIINAGDALEFLSGGLYRSTIHRSV